MGDGWPCVQIGWVCSPGKIKIQIFLLEVLIPVATITQHFINEIPGIDLPSDPKRLGSLVGWTHGKLAQSWNREFISDF